MHQKIRDLYFHSEKSDMKVYKAYNEPRMAFVKRASLFADGTKICTLGENSKIIDIPDDCIELYIIVEYQNGTKQRKDCNIKTMLPRLCIVNTQDLD